mmetsp:Transcript_33031/g.57446  ORF Transcript_33031/g.57446 Transcript_33031/m.57446 type:complete len:210 (+) Transcript_33031:46-675(+)
MDVALQCSARSPDNILRLFSENQEAMAVRKSYGIASVARRNASPLHLRRTFRTSTFSNASFPMVAAPDKHTALICGDRCIRVCNTAMGHPMPSKSRQPHWQVTIFGRMTERITIAVAPTENAAIHGDCCSCVARAAHLSNGAKTVSNHLARRLRREGIASALSQQIPIRMVLSNRMAPAVQLTGCTQRTTMKSASFQLPKRYVSQFEPL